MTLTKTAPYFAGGPPPRVSGVVLQLTASDGQQEVLREASPDTYVSTIVQDAVGKNYVLDR